MHILIHVNASVDPLCDDLKHGERQQGLLNTPWEQTMKSHEIQVIWVAEPFCYDLE